MIIWLKSIAVALLNYRYRFMAYQLAILGIKSEAPGNVCPVNVTGFVKTISNCTFSILRNTVLKYCNNCVYLVLHYSRIRLTV